MMIPDCQLRRLRAVAAAARAVPRTRPEVKRQVRRLMGRQEKIAYSDSFLGWDDDFSYKKGWKNPKQAIKTCHLYTTSSQHLPRKLGRIELGGRCLRRSIDDNAIHPDESVKVDGPFATAGASSNSNHVDRCGG